jgi:hypothetical protein
MSVDPLKLFIVEYSVNDNAVHVRSLGAVLNNNRKNVKEGRSTDYVPVGIVTSRDEGDLFKLRFEPLRQECQLERSSRNWQRISEFFDQVLEEIPPE